jgi:hypothetical protein
MRAVKFLEQLRKRREQKFQREQALGDQKFANEVAAQICHRRKAKEH